MFLKEGVAGSDQQEISEMKVRTGFVSNSSTSSYVLVVPKKNFEKVLKNSNELTKELIKKLRIHKFQKAFGKELCVLNWLEGNMNISELIDDTSFVRKFVKDMKEDDIDEFELIFETFDDFVQNLKKDKNNYIETDQEING